MLVYQRVDDGIHSGWIRSNIHWIGFVGKIYTGNPWVFTIKLVGLKPVNFPIFSGRRQGLHVFDRRPRAALAALAGSLHLRTPSDLGGRHGGREDRGADAQGLDGAGESH